MSMRIACASDAHRAFEKDALLVDSLPRVGALCFLGDVDDDAEVLAPLLAQKQPRALFYAVAGNNDPLSSRAKTLTIDLGGTRAMLTHGHLFRSRRAMAKAAKEQGCGLVLYGHTHTQSAEVIAGVHVVNPGALRAGQWALLEIGDAIEIRMMEL